VVLLKVEVGWKTLVLALFALAWDWEKVLLQNS
jgi:hypothetical protein